MRGEMNNLKFVRLLLGLSQVQISKRIGIDQMHYSKIERGVVKPRIKTLTRIAKCLSRSLHFPVDPNAIVGTNMKEVALKQLSCLEDKTAGKHPRKKKAAKKK